MSVFERLQKLRDEIRTTADIAVCKNGAVDTAQPTAIILAEVEADLETVERTIQRFSRPGWPKAERNALFESRRRLALKVAAAALVYYEVLSAEED